MNRTPGNIIISRTDSIGDVILTLPVAAVLKQHFPEIKVAFLGKHYTKPVIEACSYIDEFIDVHDFLNKRITIGGKKVEAILHVLPAPKIARRAKLLRIPLRVGSKNRIYHLLTCNRLVGLSRKNSDFHEAQLNLKLLEPLGIDHFYSLKEISNLFGLTNLTPLSEEFTHLIDNDRYNLIIHPKSQGSAREWGLENFSSLIQSLNLKHYRIFISGTKKERELLQPLFDEVGERVTDTTGSMDLYQFISFIAACDGLIANSTGPLHIASALGKDAFGIYPPVRPMHPGRWAPLGINSKVFVLNKFCNDCKGSTKICHCIKEVPQSSIKAEINKIAFEKTGDIING